MYQPPAFLTEDTQVMHHLLRDHPFAALVTQSDAGLTADHIPFVLKAEEGAQGKLQGHIAKANPLWKNLQDGAPVLAIFQGPEHYITPSWYPSKQEHGKVVPTWNYTIVHAHGTVRYSHDPEWLYAHLTDLTNQNETTRNTPWAVTDAPEDFTQRQIRGIVGIEVEISHLEGKFKLSQNRAEQDRTGVIAGLETETGDAAVEMLEIMQREGR